MPPRLAPSQALRLLLLLLPCLAASASAPLEAPPRAGIVLERVELDVLLRPAEHALYAKANLVLRNRGLRPEDIVEFDFPAPLGAVAEVERVWDYHGQLAWRSDPVELSEPRALQVALRAPLEPGDKQRVVVSYSIRFDGLQQSGSGTGVAGDRAQLAATGWYPAPAGTAEAPEWIRLSVRLPKQWRVSAPRTPKRVYAGTVLATYEVTLEHMEASEILFHAEAPDASR